jgi:hypothetical protein
MASELVELGDVTMPRTASGDMFARLTPTPSAWARTPLASRLNISLIAERGAITWGGVVVPAPPNSLTEFTRIWVEDFMNLSKLSSDDARGLGMSRQIYCLNRSEQLVNSLAM